MFNMINDTGCNDTGCKDAYHKDATPITDFFMTPKLQEQFDMLNSNLGNEFKKVLNHNTTPNNLKSNTSSIGLKFDSEKLDWSLLPIEPVEEVIKVLMVGAKKYAPNNWKHVDDFERRYWNAAMRHLTAYQKGEKFDSETGLSHLAHASCCILFLLARQGEL